MKTNIEGSHQEHEKGFASNSFLAIKIPITALYLCDFQNFYINKQCLLITNRANNKNLAKKYFTYNQCWGAGPF